MIGLAFTLGSIYLTSLEPTQWYKADNWATISIAIGATILTLVGIITSILVGNENSRRTEFIENLSFISNNVEEKGRINPDRSLTEIYNNSIRKMRVVIDQLAPLKYSEGIIGIFSFFFFLISALLAIYGYPFKFIIGNFAVGIILLVGYINYVIEEFLKIDSSSALPKKKGELTLLTLKINGNNQYFEMKSKETSIKLTEKIRRMEFRVGFVGNVRNGFLHTSIRYTNGASSYIPDSNTFLSNFGFTDGYILTLYDRRLDTGLLQSDEPIELAMDVCRDLNENPFQEDVPVEGLGRRKVYRYCSIPLNFQEDRIEIRVYEDPFFKPNFKRREIDVITIHLIKVS